MGGEGCRVRRREGEGVITLMTRQGNEKKKSREDEEGLGWRQEKYLKATAYQEIAVKQYAAQDTLPRCENTHAQCIAYKQV